MTDPLPPADPAAPTGPPSPSRPAPVRALPIARRPVRLLPIARRARRAADDGPPSRPALPAARPVTALMVTMGVFAVMMFVSFGNMAHAVLRMADTAEQTEDEIRRDLIRETVVFEGLDAAIVLAGLAVAGLPKARRADAPPLYAWALAGPALVLFLGVNIGYTLVLRTVVQHAADQGTGSGPDEVPIDIDLSDGWWAILLVCVQPAVVEELFFRYLLFGHLRQHFGVHATAWLSGVVFGMAHVGNIAGWPVLIVLGAGLGYARAYSGNLLLPVGLHFFHNLAVLAVGEVLDE